MQSNGIIIDRLYPLYPLNFHNDIHFKLQTPNIILRKPFGYCLHQKRVKSHSNAFVDLSSWFQKYNVMDSVLLKRNNFRIVSLDCLRMSDTHFHPLSHITQRHRHFNLWILEPTIMFRFSTLNFSSGFYLIFNTICCRWTCLQFSETQSQLFRSLADRKWKYIVVYWYRMTHKKTNWRKITTGNAKK